MTTISDVARRAGVSVGSVSRVLNGAGNVSDSVRSRVQGAMAELDYRPHAVAQSLRRSRSQTLGLLVPDITNPFFAELAREVERAATGRGYSLILANSDNAPELEAIHLETLAYRRVDGLIMVPSQATSRIPASIRVPLVLVDRELRGFDTVQSDHQAGTRDATAYLADIGHEIIGFVSGPRGLAVADRRRRGYLSVARPLFEAAGLDPTPYSIEGAFDYATGYLAAAALLRLVPRPSAVVCSSDQQAIGAMRAGNDAGLGIPTDLSVVGFDDVPLASLVNPRLTTVAQQLTDIGSTAVERVVHAAAGGSGARPRRVLVPTRLIVRDSCSSPRALATSLSRGGSHSDEA